MNSKEKKVGDSIIADNANWSFSGNVSRHFDAHADRSIPLYNEGHDLVAKVSDFFLSNGSICYDLGCSVGKLLALIAQRNQKKDIKFIGVDMEEGMVREARQRCNKWKNVTILKADLLGLKLKKADLIISYYTMQFIKPKNRQVMFDRVYEALNWGGGFLLFEKVRAPDARFQDIITSIYTDFKLDRKYNAQEIIAKTRSLKGILEPFSSKGNLDLMKRAGFADIITIMKYVCFEGFLGIK